jgi:hypothetical protein
MKTELALDHEKTPDGKAHVVRALLKITGTAPKNAEHVPLNLSVVLDRSGLMSGEKLDQAKEAAALLVRRLWPKDVVSVVAYDDEVEMVAEPATGMAQADLVERIRMIETQGCTNLSGGWFRGRELVMSGKREGAANRVLLLTHGLANVGSRSPISSSGYAGPRWTRGSPPRSASGRTTMGSSYGAWPRQAGGAPITSRIRIRRRQSSPRRSRDCFRSALRTLPSICGQPAPHG